MTAKKVVIIGASSGMGYALAQIYLSQGCHTALLARTIAPMQALANHFPALPHYVHQLDVCQPALVNKVLTEVTHNLGSIDLLIHCAGYGEVNPHLDFAVEEGMIETNVKGFTAVVDWTFQYFLQQQKGHLAVITSVAGLHGDRHAPGYFASKAYQISYLQALHHRARKSQLPIFITDIRPGFVDTKPIEGKRFWMCSAETAARYIFRAIERRKRIAYITPRWKWVALAIKLVPDALYEKIM
ncbi:MAG: SDR family NAD(P)-dependent oxidoreductase [Thermoflavifilum sp.]|nr:SDR family NAD(P)-dependent oxidoreductase [Thermoflavifilum sp.]